MNNVRLDFYKVSDKYIEYINKFDSHIAYNKCNRRPYIGIVLSIDDYLYFAPMFSPKLQHVNYKENLSFFKMYGNKEKTDYLGLIRFSDMIPVPKEEVTIINNKMKDKKYSILLAKQYNYINIPENRELIKEKAKKLHFIIINENKNKVTTFYKSICCNFKILEQKCLEYKK